MNFSVVSDLKWNRDYVIGPAQQGFREVKWRARGKPYSAVIRLNFLPLFRRYIALRAFLLGEQSCDSLFISFGIQRTKAPSSITARRVDTLYTTLEILDPEIDWLRSRKLRAAKQDFHITNSDPAISAQIMGHSEETARKHYAAGSQTSHYGEMSVFFEEVWQAAARRMIILQSGETVPDGVKGPLGTCVGYDEPHTAMGDAPIQPDCKRLEGCLFCDKHRVHSDECDTRKLASCAYVLRQAICLPSAETVFKPILERVEIILKDISALEGHAEMVARIVHEVEVDGELDAYWAGKLLLLNELEIAL